MSLSCDKIRFVGGGRWATIVLTELVKKFPEISVDWVTNSKIASKEKIINRDLLYKNVSLIERKNVSSLGSPDKLIIASHSIQHCLDFFANRHFNCDILLEKPLFPDFAQFESLPKIDKKRIFINLEYYNAYFMKDFFKKLKNVRCKTIDIQWHDPLTEVRDGQETKYSDLFSSLFSDQLLHVLSILKLFDNGSIVFKNIKKDSGVIGGVKINCEISSVPTSISLSRFSKKRKRNITINDGAFCLDFNSEPNILKDDGTVEFISSLNRMYPIASNLFDFIVNDRKKNRMHLSLNEFLKEIKFCFKCEEEFINLFDYKQILNKCSKLIDDKDPYLVYVAGIQYYKEYSLVEYANAIHHLKGEKGVKALLKWYDERIK